MQTWTLGREHWATAEVTSGKKASTEERLREVGSERKRVAERVALAMANSGVAMSGQGPKGRQVGKLGDEMFQ